MKNLQYFLLISGMLFFFFPLQAQTEIGVYIDKSEDNPDIEKLEKQKEKVREKEKHLLKQKIKTINQALEKEKISEEEAENQKKTAAKKHAKNIEDQIQIIDTNIALISRNLEDHDDKLYYQKMRYLKKIEIDTTKKHKKFYKTFGDVVINTGFSNTVGSGKSFGDDFSVGGSRFFDIGYEWSTGITKNNFLRFRYGVNLQFNGLKAKDDQFLVKKDENQVELEDFGQSLKKSKFRMDNLVVPLYIELGPVNSLGYADKFKIGLGGYAGLNLKSIQKLKYKQDGYRVKSKNYFNSQTESFVYGLSAFVGYDSWALFVKYDLNPVFKDNKTEEKILAFGVRMMF